MQTLSELGWKTQRCEKPGSSGNHTDESVSDVPFMEHPLWSQSFQ